MANTQRQLGKSGLIYNSLWELLLSYWLSHLSPCICHKVFNKVALKLLELLRLSFFLSWDMGGPDELMFRSRMSINILSVYAYSLHTHIAYAVYRSIHSRFQIGVWNSTSTAKVVLHAKPPNAHYGALRGTFALQDISHLWMCLPTLKKFAD